MEEKITINPNIDYTVLTNCFGKYIKYTFYPQDSSSETAAARESHYKNIKRQHELKAGSTPYEEAYTENQNSEIVMENGVIIYTKFCHNKDKSRFFGTYVSQAEKKGE